MILELPLVRQPAPSRATGPCPHRTVSDDGRVLCRKVIERDNAVTPELCGDCPFSAIDCAHLRFTLSLSSGSPLMVRFNGRTEVWEDEAPKVTLHRAACVAKVSQVDRRSACTGCSLREPILSPEKRVAHKPASPVPSNVIPFPLREAVAASA